MFEYGLRLNEHVSICVTILKCVVNVYIVMYVMAVMYGLIYGHTCVKEYKAVSCEHVHVI